MRIFPKSLFLFLLMLVVQNASANINAIDFTKVNYPKELQQQIDFLRGNEGLYNHWSPTWNYQTPKSQLVDQLTFLYNELEKLPSKNVEDELLLGDVAHYIYNMDTEPYYQKAVDHYLRAKALAPEDYRVYWFLGNHYALSANQVLSIQTYQTAIKYLPKPSAHQLFWADYSVACTNASMLGTAKYAAHQSSLIAGKETYVEQQILTVTKNTLKSPPQDTAILAHDMWSVKGRQDNKLIFMNRLLGVRVAIDSTWKLQVGDFTKHTAYMALTPQMATAKNGQKIGYSIMLLAKIPDANETLAQFLEKFTGRYKGRQPVTLPVGKIKDGIGYEIKDPSIYQDIGGSHMYAIVVERNQPDFPGMAIEAPEELPKDGSGKVTYYTVQQKYNRLKTKLYYLVLLDSCEFIHEESLAVFNGFLDNLVIE